MATKVDNGDFRAQARQIADHHARSDQRRRRMLQAIIALLVVAALVIAALVFWQVRSQRVPEAGPVPPSANQWGGIVMTADGIRRDTSDVEEVSAADVPAPEGQPSEVDADGVVEPGTAQESGDPVQIVVWQDFDCVHCAEFEKQFGDDVAELVDQGDATVEYRTVNFLDNATQYSSRAAAAYYEVANQVEPDQALEFQKEVYTHQGTGGLDDQELVDIASRHGADIEDAMAEKAWRPVVDYTAAQAQADGVAGTPTIMIDGVEWEKRGELDQAVEAAADGKSPNEAADAQKPDAAG